MLGIVRLVLFLMGVFLLNFWGCVPPGARPFFFPREPWHYLEREMGEALRDDEDPKSLQLALERSLDYLGQKMNGGNLPGSSNLFGPALGAKALYRTLTQFQKALATAVGAIDLETKIREGFTFWEAQRQGEDAPLLLTGYYEPVVEGNTQAGGPYQYPLYGRPPDLIEVKTGQPLLDGNQAKGVVRLEEGRRVPYYSRREIDTEGALEGRGLELVWLRDPWERFMLHVQGSGLVQFPDGKRVRVGYAGSNGRSYRSIGRVLVERGFLKEDEVSLPRVRAFLRDNPRLMPEIFNANERYIFFRFLPEMGGPTGSLGVPLTAGRSVALDPGVYPPGALAYLVSRQPVVDENGKMIGKKLIQRFVFNQDTGAAMQGPGRADLFFGIGREAGMAAGMMKEEGRIFILQAR
jgi:membrane-bound lytic murein transglycosylase A